MHAMFWSNFPAFRHPHQPARQEKDCGSEAKFVHIYSENPHKSRTNLRKPYSAMVLLPWCGLTVWNPVEIVSFSTLYAQ